MTAGDALHDQPDTPRYVVVRGGDPSAEELAALTVALTPVAVADDADVEATPPAWVRAALMEAAGGRPLVSADDLAAALPGSASA